MKYYALVTASGGFHAKYDLDCQSIEEALTILVRDGKAPKRSQVEIRWYDFQFVGNSYFYHDPTQDTEEYSAWAFS